MIFAKCLRAKNMLVDEPYLKDIRLSLSHVDARNTCDVSFFGENREATAFLVSTQISFTMPKNNERREGAKHSNILSTPIGAKSEVSTVSIANVGRVALW